MKPIDLEELWVLVDLAGVVIAADEYGPDVPMLCWHSQFAAERWLLSEVALGNLLSGEAICVWSKTTWTLT